MAIAAPLEGANDAHLFAQATRAPDQTDERPRLIHCHAGLTTPAFTILTPLSLWPFFINFRGPEALGNRRQKAIVCPTLSCL